MSESTVDEERRVYETQWHLDKRLNIGHILMTLTITVAMFNYAGNMDKRIQSNADSIVHHKEMVNIKQDTYSKSLDKLDIKMDKLDEKIDRVLYSIDVTHSTQDGSP